MTVSLPRTNATCSVNGQLLSALPLFRSEATVLLRLNSEGNLYLVSEGRGLVYKFFQRRQRRPMNESR